MPDIDVRRGQLCTYPDELSETSGREADVLDLSGIWSRTDFLKPLKMTSGSASCSLYPAVFSRESVYHLLI